MIKSGSRRSSNGGIQLSRPSSGWPAPSVAVRHTANTPKLRVVHERVLEQRQAIDIEAGFLDPLAQGAYLYALVTHRTFRDA